LPHGNGMPKTTIPEKLLNRSTNHLTSRFEIIPSDIADTNNNTDERELIIERAQRDSAKKNFKIWTRYELAARYENHGLVIFYLAMLVIDCYWYGFD
jgi:hypothetical protein